MYSAIMDLLVNVPADEARELLEAVIEDLDTRGDITETPKP